MLRLFRQKCRMLVDLGMIPCLESLVNACVRFEGDCTRGSRLLRARCPKMLQPMQVQNYSSDKTDEPSGKSTKADTHPECPEEPQCKEKKNNKSCGSQLKGTICNIGKAKKKEKKRKVKKESGKFKSMWDIPGCDYVNDCDVNTRLDIQHYRISDKESRQYQVTWVECPRLLIKPKKVCIYQKNPGPKRCRRKRKPVEASCSRTMPLLNPMPCKSENKLSCPRFTLPCCGPVRNPPHCKITRTITPCKKQLAPYPSFSECKKDDFAERPPIECLCLRIPMACEMWAELRRRIARGRGFTKKCGEP